MHIINYVKTENKWKNLNDPNAGKKNYTTEDLSFKSFEKTIEEWRKYCEVWKSYPDHFIDFISDENAKFKLNFYQRIFLRIFFRYEKVFITATRGSAKSFTSILAKYLKCIFLPQSNIFIVAPGKSQASSIAQEKIEEIWSNWPLLKNELRHYSFQKDYTKLIFHNNSKLDVVQMTNATRGGRRTSGIIEEASDPKMDGEKLHSIVIPLMTNKRFAACGEPDPNEIHRQQFFVTTAGVKQCFAYKKNIEILREMALGNSAFALGFGYDLPVLYDMLDLEFVNSERESDNFSPLAFSREYESVWTGSSDSSLVSLDDLNKCRVLKNAELKASDKEAEYILSYDVARAESASSANSCLVVLKIIPRGDGTYQKHLVNIYANQGLHFRDQAIFLKNMVKLWKAKILIIDNIGLGRAVTDDLVIEIDENPPYAVVNDDTYNKYRKPNSIDMVYAIKGSAKETKNSDMHNYFMSIIQTSRLKLLVPESSKKSEILKNKKKFDAEKLTEELMPYIMTDLLCEEVMNLEYKQSGEQTVVNEISRGITKDKYMALIYAMWYTYLLEKKNKQRKSETINPSDFGLIKPTNIYKHRY